MSEEKNSHSGRKITNYLMMNFFLVIVTGFVVVFFVFMIRYLVRNMGSIETAGMVGLIVMGSVMLIGLIGIWTLRIIKHQNLKTVG